MTAATSFYETSQAISEYLYFHYGDPAELSVAGLAPAAAANFPARCAALANHHQGPRRRALDLGCAVGAAACGLSASFAEVLAIDYSHGLVAAAQSMLEGETTSVSIADEGDLSRSVPLRLPAGTLPERIRFSQGDAMQLDPALGRFDFVLMANLIDRLPDPRACLETIGDLLEPGGTLAITSPYTWLEQYTPRSKWLGGFLRDGDPVRTYQTLQQILSPAFDEVAALELPFLIREHSRKNQFSLAHATLWRKK